MILLKVITLSSFHCTTKFTALRWTQAQMVCWYESMIQFKQINKFYFVERKYYFKSLVKVSFVRAILYLGTKLEYSFFCINPLFQNKSVFAQICRLQHNFLYSFQCVSQLFESLVRSVAKSIFAMWFLPQCLLNRNYLSCNQGKLYLKHAAAWKCWLKLVFSFIKLVRL